VEFSPPSSPEIPPHAQLVHVHADAGELGRLYPPALPVHGDPGLVLQDLLQALRARSGEVAAVHSERVGWVAALRTRWEAEGVSRAERDAQARGVTAFHVGRELGRILPPHTLVVEEAVRSSPAFLEGYCARPGGLLRTAGGSLGWGVPAALGAQMADPRRPVVAVVGDGCLHFTPQALWTGVRQRLPVLVVVLNNRKYLAVEAGVRRLLGGKTAPGTPGVDLSGIDHAAVARGYGAGGLRVEGREELGDVLREGFQRALQEGRPYLVDVPVEDEPGF
jgi:benzoylformate decarboxylase